MVFYKYTFQVNQSLENTFKYVLSKDYLTRFFESDKEENLLISKGDNYFLKEGEELELMSNDEETIMRLKIKVEEIVWKKLIRLNYHLEEIVDKEEGTVDDDIEMFNFIKKYLGSEFGYSIELTQMGAKVKVEEKITVATTNTISKILFKVLGFYYQIIQRKIYKQIINEIELM